jgi:hypothetical protein
MAALVDWWYVKGTNVLGQRIYRITACILPWRQTRVSTTKSGKERKIYIGPRTVEVFKAHRARQLEERMAVTAATAAISLLLYPASRMPELPRTRPSKL